MHRYTELTADTVYPFDGREVRTLARPPGELLCRFATVNDVHFGEIECGRIDDDPQGPVLRIAEGEAPYPETMNRGAAGEIEAAGMGTVVVKGDLTADGQPAEFAAFETCWTARFGTSLHVIRGNHDAYLGQDALRRRRPGRPARRAGRAPRHGHPDGDHGRITASSSNGSAMSRVSRTDPVIVLGHHQSWLPGGTRSADYSGINPDDSERLVALIAHQPQIVAYAAGHTHRNRVRRLPTTGACLPSRSAA